MKTNTVEEFCTSYDYRTFKTSLVSKCQYLTFKPPPLRSPTETLSKITKVPKNIIIIEPFFSPCICKSTIFLGSSAEIIYRNTVS